MRLGIEDHRQLCRIIASSIAENGMPPTIREIAEELGLSEQSTATVQYRLLRAETEGYLRRKSDKARAIRLTDAGRALVADVASL